MLTGSPFAGRTMPLTQIPFENMNSPYAEQLGKGFGRLRFGRLLEREFKDFYDAICAPRGRIASVAALTIVLGVAALKALFGQMESADIVMLLHIGILCPLLTLFVTALHLKQLQSQYSRIAANGALLLGVVVTYMSVSAMADGGDATYMFAVAVLTNLFASLLLGLLFYHAALISLSLVLTYGVLGYSMGIESSILLNTFAMLGGAATIGMISAYYREHSLRLHFLETQLLHELAERDGLTGLYNRRIFDTLMQRVWRQSRREETAIQIVLIDIDQFKIYNDLYGHQSGDETLQRVASCIARYAKRPTDFCARYGGEEFVLVVYGPLSDYAKSVPEQIRRDVMDLGISHEGSRVSDCVTVSIGVAVARPGSGRSLAGAIQAADEALYQAKKAGRNKIVCKDAAISEVETGKFRAALHEPA
jgi:diguanylate cyclase (GGDEF)-like protein